MLNKLPDFNKASVLVVGDIMLDRYWFGDTARVSPEAPVPVVKIKQNDERPGGAANVASNIKALQADVTLIGITGKDEAAKSLINNLDGLGIKHDILEIPEIPTITKLRIISRHQQLIRLDFEEKLQNTHAESIVQRFKKHLKSTDLVVLSDYNKGTLAICQELIKLANAANIPVIVDPKGKDFTRYEGAFAITPNLAEFEEISGQAETETEVSIKANDLLKKYNIKNMLLTRGERGMTLFEEKAEEFNLPAHAREVYDVTGAGDTVISVFAAAIAAKADIKSSVKLANLAASLAVSKLGAAAISANELQTALEQNESAITYGITNEEDLLSTITKARQNGKKVVFTNGCFDLLHAGHVTYLEQAKQLGDILIVATNDDSSVKQNKGPTRPINDIKHRMSVLASLTSVDFVIPFNDKTPERLLKLLQPDILVKGGDYTKDQVVGAKIVNAYGGQVRVLGVIKDISTSLMIERMIKSMEEEL